jgi:5'-nucleotidase
MDKTILITNDDGYRSPALVALRRELEKVANPIVVAPDHNWSAAGHTKTMHKPLRVWEGKLPDGAPAYITTGAPSDCVALALLGIVPQEPDLVVSGINMGENLGADVTYSGTVAGAMEGVVNGIQSISVSVETIDPDADFTVAARIAAGIAGYVIRYGLPPGTFLNVNIPYLPLEEIKGIQVTRLGRRIYRDLLVKRIDPRGRPYYWIGGDRPSGVPEDGTDIGALENGYVSITPLQMDMTNYRFMEELRSWPLSLEEMVA